MLWKFFSSLETVCVGGRAPLLAHRARRARTAIGIMDTIPGDITAVKAAETGELPIAIILAHAAVMIGFVALGVYDISCQRRADPTHVDAELVGSASGAYGVPKCAPSPPISSILARRACTVGNASAA